MNRAQLFPISDGPPVLHATIHSKSQENRPFHVCVSTVPTKVWWEQQQRWTTTHVHQCNCQSNIRYSQSGEHWSKIKVTKTVKLYLKLWDSWKPQLNRKNETNFKGTKILFYVLEKRIPKWVFVHVIFPFH